MKELEIGNGAFKESTLDIASWDLFRRAYHLVPLLYLSEFVIGSGCFTNTSIFVPMSENRFSSALRIVETPNIDKMIIGDNSFTNTRITPIACIPESQQNLDEKYNDPDEIRRKESCISKLMDQDELTKDDFTMNMMNSKKRKEHSKSVAFSLLKKIVIGENCFYSTVVFMVHSLHWRTLSKI